MQQELSTKFCARPWDFLEIGPKHTYCCCPTWVNLYSFGEIDENFDLDKVWNSSAAQEFRKSILDGSFRFCNATLCPMIQNGTLPDKNDPELNPRYQRILEGNILISDIPIEINLCYDQSCNLRCPSCRKNFIYLKKNEPEYKRKQTLQENILKHLDKHPDQRIQINCTGSGDPFGSTLFMEFLTQLDAKKTPNINVLLQTNGVLFTAKNWKKLSKIHGNASTIISLDAGTKEAYDKCRVGGDWNRLMKNLRLVKCLKAQGKIHWVRLDMVAQNNNFRTMKKFVEIAMAHDFNCYLSRIVNWGTFPDEIFATHNIFDPRHPSHQEFIGTVNSLPDYPKLDYGNLSEFRK